MTDAVPNLNAVDALRFHVLGHGQISIVPGNVVLRHRHGGRGVRTQRDLVVARVHTRIGSGFEHAHTHLRGGPLTGPILHGRAGSSLSTYPAVPIWPVGCEEARHAERLRLQGVVRRGPDGMDVTDPGAATRAVAEATTAFGHLDVVVNNAGYANSAPIEEMADDDFRAQIETNLFGVVNVTRAALPVLRAQRSGVFASTAATTSGK